MQNQKLEREAKKNKADWENAIKETKGRTGM